MKLSIRKKFAITTIILLVLIIISSLFITTIIFNERQIENIKKICHDASYNMSNELKDDLDFLVNYKGKIDEIYKENIKEIELNSYVITNGNTGDFLRKEKYF